MDATGRLTSHYGSLMMGSSSLPMGGAPLAARMGDTPLGGRMGESRHPSQYDLSKGATDAFSGYYSSMGRFGAEVDSSLPAGLDLPLQQAKKEHYW